MNGSSFFVALLRAALVIFTAFFLGACVEEEKGGNNNNTGNNEANNTGNNEANNTGNNNDEVIDCGKVDASRPECQQEIRECETHADCPAEEKCDHIQGACVPCLCDDNQYCEDGICYEFGLEGTVCEEYPISEMNGQRYQCSGVPACSIDVFVDLDGICAVKCSDIYIEAEKIDVEDNGRLTVKYPNGEIMCVPIQ